MQHQFEEKPQKIQHFSHRHDLNLSSIYSTSRDPVWCWGCDLDIFGPAYGCQKCEFWLHESCFQLPPQINHDFHPLHPLIAQRPTLELIFYCNACQQKHSGFAFRCDECNFSLDHVCAMLTPTFKHKLHPHKLLYFVRPISDPNPFSCNICERECQVPFYRCVECDFNLHLRCVLPNIVQHKCHIHPLALRDKVVEDDSGEYYCDICETERNGDHAVYYCEECTVVAHIECIITEENTYTSLGNVELDRETLTAEETEEELDREALTAEETEEELDREAMTAEETETEEASDDEKHALNEQEKATPQIFKEMAPSVSEMKIKHVSHKHMLKLCEVINEDIQCNGCLLNICGPAYFCQKCRFFLHKLCAELAPKIQHPFHSLHPLTLLAHSYDRFVCDECRTFSQGFHFVCSKCNFRLDMKCAALTHHPLEYKDKRTRQIRHFSDRHALSFYNFTVKGLEIDCLSCQLPILGPAYGCDICDFLVHESCSQMPQQIQHEFHPLHPLIGQELVGLSLLRELGKIDLNCDACGQFLPDKVHYGCEDCNFFLDIECTSLVPTLKHQRDEHKLLYITPKRHKYFSCNVCGKDCDDPFYRCVQCKFNLHVECTPLPDVVEHKCHIHPLTLMEKYIDDRWDQQCCDACETERNPDHGLYYCMECNFAAHIECVIPKLSPHSPCYPEMKAVIQGPSNRFNHLIQSLEAKVLEKDNRTEKKCSESEFDEGAEESGDDEEDEYEDGSEDDSEDEE